jgi:protein dithiol oxidoreductase (disulfide-forming)
MRRLAVFMTMVLLALAGLAQAAELSPSQYTVLNPPRPTEAPDNKIEVTEFFWYGCPHCSHLEPFLEQWAKKLPSDVSFRRVPAIFPDGRWAPGARIFYTLDAMGLLDKLHSQVFDAIHKDRLNLMGDQQTLLQWMAGKGVDRQKFAEVYNSFAVQSRVARAKELTQEYGFDGVPAIYVAGRYTPTEAAAADPQGALKVVSELIDKVRRERGRK